jgi:hypothetical protein
VHLVLDTFLTGYSTFDSFAEASHRSAVLQVGSSSCRPANAVGCQMAEDYADLSDDDLIDLLVAKTRASRRVQPATDTNGRGLASRPGRKQDDAVKTPAKVVDSRDASIRSLIGLRPEPKVHL